MYRYVILIVFLCNLTNAISQDAYVKLTFSETKKDTTFLIEYLNMKYVLSQNISSVTFRDISKIPDSIFLMKDLEKLQFRHCSITEIPNKINQLKNLRVLSFSSCEGLTNVTYLDSLKKLEALYLNSTGLSEIPIEVCRISNLKQLSFTKTQITEIPNHIKLLQKLEYFYARNTKVTSISPEIGKLPKLKNIVMFNTDISYLPKTIVKSPNLQLVWFDWNEIKNGKEIKRMLLKQNPTIKFSNW